MNFFKPMFNSFFRTLGRVLCYILIGAIVATVFNKLTVHAESVDSYFIPTVFVEYAYNSNYEVSGGRECNKITPWTINGNSVSGVTCFNNSGNIGTNGGNFSIEFVDFNFKAGHYYTLYVKTLIPSFKFKNLAIAYNDFHNWGDKSAYYSNFSYTSGLSSEGTILSFNFKSLVTGDRFELFFTGNAGSPDDTIFGIYLEDKGINYEENISDTINDSSSPNLDGLNNSAGWLPSGPIDSILNLPLTFLNSLTTNLSKACNSVDLPLPFVNKNITLPCLNTIYSQIDGLSVWINSIGIIASAFIIFQYLMNLYKWVDDTLTFRENNFIDNWSGV